MQRLRQLKIIWLFIMLSAISSFSYAEKLRCKQDFDKFKRIFLYEKQLFDQGHFEESLRFYRHIEYSELFKVNHLNQVFWNAKWEDDQVFKEELEHRFNRYKTFKKVYNIAYSFNKPNKNFLLNKQELCIFTLITQITSDIHPPMISDRTMIMVRGIGQVDWRRLSIDSSIREQDFHEFFPNFPKNIVIKELQYTH